MTPGQLFAAGEGLRPELGRTVIVQNLDDACARRTKRPESRTQTAEKVLVRHGATVVTLPGPP